MALKKILIQKPLSLVSFIKVMYLILFTTSRTLSDLMSLLFFTRNSLYIDIYKGRCTGIIIIDGHKVFFFVNNLMKLYINSSTYVATNINIHLKIYMQYLILHVVHNQWL